VNNILRLLETYRDDARTAQILEHFDTETPTRLFLPGMIGAQACFVLTGAYLNDNRNMMLIASDKEEAAYLQNNLSGMLESKTILFFPDSFKKPASFEEINKNNVLMRAETVNKLISHQSGNIIVTYPEALFEKVVAPKVLNKSKIEVTLNEKLDVDFLMELLFEHHFERVDFVYEPGQFSIRGGIVDVFSFGNDQPYRIELFDDEVESIRTFDVHDQLSIKNIAKVVIIPNIQSHFDKKDKRPLLDILPSDTAIWVVDVEVLIERIQTCFEKASELAENLEPLELEEDEKEFLNNRTFILPKDIMSKLLDFTTIELGQRSYFDKEKIQIPYDTSPQPSFNKNFDLLIKSLQDNTKAKFENYIFSGNKRQFNRFYAIFEDLKAKVEFHPINIPINEGFIDNTLKVSCYTDHQIFERYHKFKIRKGYDKGSALNMKMLRELKPGDFVTHIDHGIGRYSGLEKLNINGHIQESVRMVYRDNDLLYISINSLHKITKFVGKEGKPPKLSKIGSDSWANLKRKTKKKVKDIAEELIKLYAARRASKGHAFPEDGYLQNELEASFIYEDTPDQEKATADVKRDMQREFPMDRLICGDVGFGKTEIAIRAAFKAVVDGKQVAVLVPTTILALQHYHTFKDRLGEFGVDVDYINRFRTAKQKREIIEKLKEGKIDLVIGTHAILSKKMGFKDLGLLIIDEEQKFGVAAKEKLRNLKVNVDTLTLTATPIPRTLQFSLMAARDLSVINTPPPNRQPIQTEVRTFKPEVIKEAIYYEIYRGGQVFFIHNRVKDLPSIVHMVRQMCPDIDIAMAHGQMESKELESTLIDFIDGKYDVLCSTNIIETGLDIPNANTIIINNAHHFGLSDLHQLRGRVGRSNKKAFAYLFSPPTSTLTDDARKRLKTIIEFSALGSGLNIAMRDLDIRGAGNLLGGEQSGFITDIGYETYQKILDEAIQELKETKFKDLFKEDLEREKRYVRDVQLETDLEMLIPDEYVGNFQERLNLYQELDNVKDEEALAKFSKQMSDRFGKIPWQVSELFDALRLRWLCKELGFERLILKSRKLRCYFIRNEESPYFESDLFHCILQYVPTKGDRHLSFKKSNTHFILVRDDVSTLKVALKVLGDLKKGCIKE